MTGKRSRYYRLEDAAFPDRDGIERQCKALRRTPDVAGQFLHTLEASDRLDHLAYKYYRQSLHWWRICDANPEFAEPLALLGKTPLAVIRLELIWDSAGAPPLAGLYAALAGMTGIVRMVKEGENGLPGLEIADGAPLFTLAGGLRPALDSAVLRQALPPALNTALVAQGLTLPVAGLRFSKPEDNLWHIETGDARLYRFRYTGATGLVTVNGGVQRYSLVLSVAYNRDSVTQQAIVSAIEARGFEVGDVEPVARIGRGIVIPPRYTGRD
jgi:hypothetical protein